MTGKQISVLAIIFALLVLGGFIYISNQNSSNTQQVQGVSEQNAKSQQDLEFSQRFVAYSDENLKKATENDGKAIVFFHAGWCPMCQAAEKDFKENFSKVPANVTILKTDYDTSTKLKAKYGITMQDTWVQINKDGKEVTKWNSGGEGIKTLLANLK